MLEELVKNEMMREGFYRSHVKKAGVQAPSVTAPVEESKKRPAENPASTSTDQLSAAEIQSMSAKTRRGGSSADDHTIIPVGESSSSSTNQKSQQQPLLNEGSIKFLEEKLGLNGGLMESLKSNNLINITANRHAPTMRTLISLLVVIVRNWLACMAPQPMRI